MDEAAYQERIEQLGAEVQHLRTQVYPHLRWRRFLSALLVTIGFLTLIPASILVWANRTLTDPNHYISVVGPLIEQPSVQSAITQAAGNAILKNVDLTAAVAGVLPPRADFLSGAIAAQIQNYTYQTINRIVASDQFSQVWGKANQAAQQRFMALATSGRTDPTIDLNEVYSAISDRLKETKLAPLANRQLPTSLGNIEVVTSPALTKIPHYMAVLSDLRWLFVGIAIGTYVLALWVAPIRRRTAGYIGLSFIAVAFVSFIIARLIRELVLTKISDPIYGAAADTTWRAFLKPLAIQMVVLSLAGLIITLVAWLMGPAPVAVRFRRSSQSWLSRSRQSLLPSVDHSGLVPFLNRHHQAFLWALLLLSLSLVLIFAPFSVVSFLLLMLVVLLLLIILEFLAAPTITRL